MIKNNIQHLLNGGCEQDMGCFPGSGSLVLHNEAGGRHCDGSHFTDKETEAQKEEGPCPRSPSWQKAGGVSQQSLSKWDPPPPVLLALTPVSRNVGPPAGGTGS